MRQAEAIPVTVGDEDARKLLGRLAPGLYERMLEIIASTQHHVKVSSLNINSFRSYEDPDWEELVFDVRVLADRQTAFDYLGRISHEEERGMDEAEPSAREQLIRLISVFVKPV